MAAALVYEPIREALSTSAIRDAAAAVSVPPDEGEDTTPRPDIEWMPSYSTFISRVERLASIGLERPSTVPSGWPTEVSGPRVWSWSDFKSEEDFIVHLTEQDIEEAERALSHFKTLPCSDDPDSITTETFPLPTLAPKLDEISKELHNGRGFVILRGLNPDHYSNTDNVLLYLGITSYVADLRGCQDYDGRMLVHIKDVKKPVTDYARRGPFSPYTNGAQPFHTDRCDILSMYAFDTAETGGQSVLASGATIYNEIAASRPDIIHTLAKSDWIFDEFHQGDYHVRPLLHQFGPHGPSFVYSRRPLTGSWFAPHHPNVPAMSEAQAEALDMVHFTAEKHAVEVTLRRGDIELVNNFSMFHARRGFVDGGKAASGRGRHMMRLWLRSSKYGWPLPDPIARSAREIYDPDTGFRANAIWDMFTSPPLGRGTYKRMECN